MIDRFESDSRSSACTSEARNVGASTERGEGQEATSRQMSLNVTGCHTCETDSITSERGAATPKAVSLDLNEPRDPLSERQQLALEMVLAGQSDMKVAQAVGVSRRTIIRWRLQDADFIAEVRRRRQRLCSDAADQLRRLLAPSLNVLTEFLRSDHDVHRMRAATSVLRIARVGTLLKSAAGEE